MSLTIQQIIEETKIRKQLAYEKAQIEQIKTPATVEKETEEEAFRNKRKENYVDHVNTFLFPNKIEGKKTTVQNAELVEAKTAKDTNDVLTSEVSTSVFAQPEQNKIKNKIDQETKDSLKDEKETDYDKEGSSSGIEIIKETKIALDTNNVVEEEKDFASFTQVEKNKDEKETDYDKEGSPSGIEITKGIFNLEDTNDVLTNERSKFIFIQKEEEKDETKTSTTEEQLVKEKGIFNLEDTNDVLTSENSKFIFTQAEKNKDEVLKKTEEQLVKEKGIFNLEDTNDVLTSESSKFIFIQKEEEKAEPFKLKLKTEQNLERRNSEERKALGHIYVSPVNIDVIGNNAPFLKIPLQTNLSVASNEIKAAYNATDFLNRIGSVQQYVRTESQTFSLETEYHITSDNEDGYSMSDLQRIEKMYQSLVFPKIRNITLETGDKYSFYSRPPIINIAIGDFGDSSKISVPSNNQLASTTSNKNVINNFFTYIKYKKETPTVYFKDFVVTSVSIEKDYKETPFYIAKKSNIVNGKVVEDYVPYDLVGFSVKLEIIEIDPNYFGVSPTFDDYAKFAYGVSSNQNRNQKRNIVQ